jgi:antitoxin component YwqK of YwqJK toxin-antitoxin module
MNVIGVMVDYILVPILSIMNIMVFFNTIGVVNDIMQDKTPRNKQGQQHGCWETYFDNGQLCYKGLFINNDKFGYHESYFIDGKLHWRGHYNNNELCGYHEHYWNNESIKIDKVYYAR